MKTVVFIGNDYMGVFRGKYKKKEFFMEENRSIVLPKGTVVNGVITNPPTFEEELRKLSIRGKVTLLIDSTNIVVKLLEVGGVKTKQLAFLMEQELGLGEASSDMVFDYTMIDRNKGQYLCFGCPKNMLGGFVQAFGSAGIGLESIDSVVNCLVKFALQSTQMNRPETSWLFNMIAGENMLSVLFENGRFVVVNRNRIFGEVDSGGYAGELYSKLSTMVQFSQSQKAKFPIKNSYYWGLSGEGIQQLNRWIELNEAQIEASAVELVKDPAGGGTPFAAIGLVKMADDLDFLKAYKKAMHPPKRIGAGGVRGLVAGLSLLLIGGGWYYFYHQNTLLTQQLTHENQLIEQYTEEFSRYNRYVNQYGLLKSYAEALSNSSWEAFYMKKLSGEDFKKLYEVGFVSQLESVRLDMGSGEVYFEGISANQYDLLDYAEYLDHCGLFSKVDYQSYAEDEGGYIVLITAVLKELEA